MTETPNVTSRLRKSAAILGQRGLAGEALANLMSEASACIEHDAKVIERLEASASARRAFLEQAVCHPGPPASEHDDYDPDAPLGELEAAVLERLDRETEAERDLWDIRKLCEQALGRTPDPARTTIQVVRDLLAQPTTMQRLNEQRRDLRAAERAAAGLVPIVRPEHFAGPFPAISGYVKRTAEARAATIDQALRMLKDGQRLAVHDEPERVDILFLDPGQEPPPGQTWTVYGPMVLDDQLASATGSEIRQDAIAEQRQRHHAFIDGSQRYDLAAVIALLGEAAAALRGAERPSPQPTAVSTLHVRRTVTHAMSCSAVWEGGPCTCGGSG